MAVTGSVGKSTTKEMISAVLESTYKTSKTPANHNNDIGMPMAILAMEEDTEVAVLEMGMNHFGEISYLSKIAQPDVAVIINIGTMHIEFLGSQEGICKAKMEIVDGMAPEGRLILNGDDKLLRNLERQPMQPVTYFGSSKGCAVQAVEFRQDEEYLTFRVEAGPMAFSVELALEGEHFVPDALTAITIGLMLDVPVTRIQIWSINTPATKRISKVNISVLRTAMTTSRTYILTTTPLALAIFHHKQLQILPALLSTRMSPLTQMT